MNAAQLLFKGMDPQKLTIKIMARLTTMSCSGSYQFLQKRSWRQGVILLALSWVAGCSTFGPSESGSRDQANHVVILLSDESPAFQRVADNMASQAGRPIENFWFNGIGVSQTEVLRRLQQSAYSTVVAIGLPAARAARQLTGKRLVFCQVSSHEEGSLAAVTTRGVSSVPPVQAQFRAWRALNPKLRTVGVITGPQQGALLAEARLAAQANGLELIAVEVKSDRETLYAFRRLSRRVQGLWLVPDNRVLSNAVLRDLMTHAVKEGKQVLAFSHELLGLGALLSVESSPADIASQVLAQTRVISDKHAAVLPLTRGETRVNATMLKRFGLSMPNGFEGRLHAS